MTTENNAFENAKHIDETGNEYWSARTLQQILEYSEWRNFQRAIDKAITACETSGNDKIIILLKPTNDRPWKRRTARSGGLPPFPLCLLPDCAKRRSVQKRHCRRANLLCRANLPPRDARRSRIQVTRKSSLKGRASARRNNGKRTE